jgi:hypothetical protein
MKENDEDLKAARDFNRGCISLLRYVVLQDEYKTSDGIIFLGHLKCGKQFMGAARDRETNPLSPFLYAALGNRAVTRFAAARSVLTPMH